MDITNFYAAPVDNQDVLDKYDVEYILVSSYERSDYYVDKAGLEAIADVVYANREGTIYKVREGE